MLHVECKGCHTSAYVDCRCPEIGHDPSVAGAHHPMCGMSDLSGTVVCPESSDCCKASEVHPGVSHDEAANACPGILDGHDAPCPEPDVCGVFQSEGCEGGHCHKDIPDCTVCRPLIVTVMPGSIVVTPVGG